MKKNEELFFFSYSFKIQINISSHHENGRIGLTKRHVWSGIQPQSMVNNGLVGKEQKGRCT